jgi:hypothetical protein
MSYGYGNRNRRIQQEAARIAQQALAVETMVERFKQHHIAEAERANKPLTGQRDIARYVV